MVNIPKKKDARPLAEKLLAVEGPGAELEIAKLVFADLVSRTAGKNRERGIDPTHGILVALKKVLPNTNRQLIGDAVADLSSLWSAAQRLEETLNAIAKLRSPRDLDKLEDL